VSKQRCYIFNSLRRGHASISRNVDMVIGYT